MLVKKNIYSDNTEDNPLRIGIRFVLSRIGFCSSYRKFSYEILRSENYLKLKKKH